LRKYVCGFLQDNLKIYGLSVKEILILEYLNQFFKTDKVYQLIHNGKVFYWIANSKILQDLPVLKIGKRQLINIFNKLSGIGLVEILIKGNKKFLHVYFEKLTDEESIADLDIINLVSEDKCKQNMVDDEVKRINCDEEKSFVDEIDKQCVLESVEGNDIIKLKNKEKINKNYEKNIKNGVIYNNLYKNIAIKLNNTSLKIYYNKHKKIKPKLFFEMLKQSVDKFLNVMQFKICFEKATINKICDGCFLIEKTCCSIISLNCDLFFQAVFDCLK